MICSRPSFLSPVHHKNDYLISSPFSHPIATTPTPSITYIPIKKPSAKLYFPRDGVKLPKTITIEFAYSQLKLTTSYVEFKKSNKREMMSSFEYRVGRVFGHKTTLFDRLTSRYMQAYVAHFWGERFEREGGSF